MRSHITSLINTFPFPLRVTGALGITIANPTDLVKVRLQAEGKLPPGVPRRYSGALSAYSTIVRQVRYSTSISGKFLLPFPFA